MDGKKGGFKNEKTIFRSSNMNQKSTDFNTEIRNFVYLNIVL